MYFMALVPLQEIVWLSCFISPQSLPSLLLSVNQLHENVLLQPVSLGVSILKIVWFDNPT